MSSLRYESWSCISRMLMCLLELSDIVFNLIGINLIDIHVLWQKDTPLHYAIVYGSVLVVELLIRHGADVDSKDNVSTPWSSYSNI